MLNGFLLGVRKKSKLKRGMSMKRRGLLSILYGARFFISMTLLFVGAILYRSGVEEAGTLFIFIGVCVLLAGIALTFRRYLLRRL